MSCVLERKSKAQVQFISLQPCHQSRVHVLSPAALPLPQQLHQAHLALPNLAVSFTGDFEMYCDSCTHNLGFLTCQMYLTDPPDIRVLTSLGSKDSPVWAGSVSSGAATESCTPERELFCLCEDWSPSPLGCYLHWEPAGQHPSLYCSFGCSGKSRGQGAELIVQGQLSGCYKFNKSLHSLIKRWRNKEGRRGPLEVAEQEGRSSKPCQALPSTCSSTPETCSTSTCSSASPGLTPCPSPASLSPTRTTAPPGHHQEAAALNKGWTNNKGMGRNLCLPQLYQCLQTLSHDWEVSCQRATQPRWRSSTISPPASSPNPAKTPCPAGPERYSHSSS